MNTNITCKNFIKEILYKKYWFSQLIKNKSCDLILLSGTAAKETRDSFSDIDIFIVCKIKAQIKYLLKPVTVYNYKGETIEVSVVSTEKLFNDQNNKENLFWWNKTSIIEKYNKKAELALKNASSISKKEFLDRLWTNFVYFEINSFNFTKQIKRDEPLSVNIIFNENIRLTVDSILVNYMEFSNIKWFGSILKKNDKILYKKIIRAQQAKGFKDIKYYNNKLRLIIINILKQNNFTDKEIYNWESCNLSRITFQYR